MSTPTSTDVVPVVVKDAWYSKINWTQVITIAFTLATYAGAVVPKELEPAIMTAVTAIGGVLTIIFRTWFNPTVTPQSVGKK